MERTLHLKMEVKQIINVAKKSINIPATYFESFVHNVQWLFGSLLLI